jgi:hypothetical protein
MRRFTVVMLVLCAVSFSHAQKTIKVNFDSTDNYQLSCGVFGTATKSGLDATARTAIIAKMQTEYDDAVGKGKVIVSEGSGGDINMIVTGGEAPAAAKRALFGNAGRDGQVGLVFLGRFQARGLTGDTLNNAVGETAAHEAGHKLGLNHNGNSPPTKMTSPLSLDDRKMDSRKFNNTDKVVLAQSLGLTNAEQKDDSDSAAELGVSVGLVNYKDNVSEPDDIALETTAWENWAGLGCPQFGYISSDGEFVFQGDCTTTRSSGAIPFSFQYDSTEDIAVSFDGVVYPLSQFGTAVLTVQSPYNPSVYAHAFLNFNIPQQPPLSVEFNIRGYTTGGFIPAGQ